MRTTTISVFIFEITLAQRVSTHNVNADQPLYDVPIIYRRNNNQVQVDLLRAIQKNSTDTVPAISALKIPIQQVTLSYSTAVWENAVTAVTAVSHMIHSKRLRFSWSDLHINIINQLFQFRVDHSCAPSTPWHYWLARKHSSPFCSVFITFVSIHETFLVL